MGALPACVRHCGTRGQVSRRRHVDVRRRGGSALCRAARRVVANVLLCCSAGWCAAALAAPPATTAIEVAWLRDGHATLATLDEAGSPHTRPLPTALRTPLGSLWKLFVHAYEVDNALADVPYVCGGHDRQEAYCCQAGGRISREPALVRSCGLYFAPGRLGIDAAAWRTYWSAHGAPAWLQTLSRVVPDTEVPVIELLQVLEALPAQADARRVLLDVVLDARDPAVATELGAQWRIKTWSWHRGSDVADRVGGFAGWWSDGTPVWARAAGTSQRVLAQHARALGRLGEQLAANRRTLQAADAGREDGCVDVHLFARYPIRGIQAREGRLQGRFEVTFDNGNKAQLRSEGEVVLDAKRQLHARLSREEYVARVLDREATATPREAARAMSVAIRSYLQQNARRGGACLAIDDSSATQRVSPRPATAAARAVAAFTEDLVLSGADVRYHRDTPSPDTLAWTQAVCDAQAGATWRDLLQGAWPRATLSRWDHPQLACAPLPAARDWLLARLAAWRPTLDREAGYAETRDFETCRLAGGRPHVERAQRRLHVRALASQQDRLDLVHEYLHLAFDAHPNGQDETYVEALARRLLLE